MKRSDVEKRSLCCYQVLCRLLFKVDMVMYDVNSTCHPLWPPGSGQCWKGFATLSRPPRAWAHTPAAADLVASLLALSQCHCVVGMRMRSWSCLPLRPWQALTDCTRYFVLKPCLSLGSWHLAPPLVTGA